MTTNELKQVKKARKAARDHFSYRFRSAGRPTDKNKLWAMVEHYSEETGFSLAWVARQQQAVIDLEVST